MAEVYWRRGDLDQSAFYWEAAMLLWPRDAQLMNEFANFNIARANWSRAIELLERSRAQHPWLPRTHELLAYAYAHNGQPGLAIESANQAFRLGGARTMLFAVKAQAYETQGRQGEAIGSWRAALTSARVQSWVHKGMLARAQARYGDVAGARSTADSARFAHARDSLAAFTLKELGLAIGQGCYEADRVDPCPDPMRGWLINGERIVLQKVSNSQNVSRLPGPAGAVRPPFPDTITRSSATR
jgi:tetratricopeptide (TPR) repeat protein